MGVSNSHNMETQRGCLYNALLLSYYCLYSEFAEIPPNMDVAFSDLTGLRDSSTEVRRYLHKGYAMGM